MAHERTTDDLVRRLQQTTGRLDLTAIDIRHSSDARSVFAIVDPVWPLLRRYSVTLREGQENGVTDAMALCAAMRAGHRVNHIVFQYDPSFPGAFIDALQRLTALHADSTLQLSSLRHIEILGQGVLPHA